jgi:toxin ParE1/3/4
VATARRLVFSPSAIGDLEEVLAWYAAQLVPEVGRRFVEEIIARAEGLLRHPDMGRVVPEFGAANLRELIHPPFRIVYRREKNQIQVIRIWRTERILDVPEGSRQR